MTVSMLCDGDLNQGMSFLEAHEETSQFLINNLKTHGPAETSHHNSGNFKVIKEKGKILGVYCLTKRGNLLAQFAAGVNPDIVIESCKEENYPIKGFIGDWSSVSPVLNRFKEINGSFKPSYESKEILYKYDLKRNDSSLVHDQRVRLLKNSDFLIWNPLSLAYLKELGLKDDLSEAQRKMDFDERTKAKVWWGLFEGEELRSISALNSCRESVGQVGGVFTPKSLRRKGYSRSTMRHMLKDCIDIHKHRKNILFTGEEDIPAQKLYESLGYQNIGYFALILS